MIVNTLKFHYITIIQVTSSTTIAITDYRKHKTTATDDDSRSNRVTGYIIIGNDNIYAYILWLVG